jgi:hypothetical protein
MNVKKFYAKAWVRKHLDAGLHPTMNSKHARQRVKFPQGERAERLRARHKRGRRVTKYELGDV